MTNEEVIAFYNDMLEYYGGSLPSFEHYPIQFAHYVKLYKYYKGIS